MSIMTVEDDSSKTKKLTNDHENIFIFLFFQLTTLLATVQSILTVEDDSSKLKN
jgi:hypothetical protein